MKPYLALAKPRITVLVALCAAAGYALAWRGPLDWPRLAWTVVGVALASASTGCLNQVLEADLDARMKRTAHRPLPMGQVTPAEAHALGLLWGGAGLGLLAWKVNGMACALTAFTLVSYLLVYTPMKRFSPLSTWVGAIPGALPPVIGWTAAGGALDASAAVLFGVQFLWQMPHFLALAWLYREDYARGGYRVVSVTDPTGVELAWQLAATSAFLLAVSILPFGLGLAGRAYLVTALALGGAFLALSLAAARELTAASVRRVFLASLAYLPLVLTALVADRL
ncbi:MAG: protoheme IX farnesyltransferase [Elusimicrobia bacterium CG11_big_fil_rev_8_21_14_0_20_64_6]|nr:MAG: protoheme IX farnesyltransferase [Elusimicrobia bacterium CG11_big_fil_rev_8_21_14_0_20_64_6]